MSNFDKMTEKQKLAWHEAIAEINRYNIGAREDPDHYEWHFDWHEETRAGRGQVFSAMFIDGEHYAQVFMDVYGFPSVSVAALDIMHNSSDEECPCDFCVAAREADEQVFQDDLNGVRGKVYNLGDGYTAVDYSKTRVVAPQGPRGPQGPQGPQFNSRPLEADYTVAPGEWLLEWMEENHISIVTLAHFLNWEVRWLKRFLKGKHPVDSVIASDLEAITKIPAKSWLAFQEKYDKDKERLKKTLWKRVLAGFLGVRL